MDHPRSGALIDALDRAPDEEDAVYLQRVRRALPCLPEELVADWFVAHGTNVLDNSRYLDHTALRFRRVQWPTDRFAHVTTRCEIDDWIDAFVARDGDRFRQGGLAEYMLAHGTWPVPPAILISSGRTIGAFRVGPVHLLEGHHRLAYLLGLAREGNSSLQVLHAVWEAREQS